MKLKNRRFQHCAFINSGYSDIHVKYMCAVFLLGKSLAQNITDIIFQKCLLKALFSGRIYSFAYYDRLVSEINSMSIR